MLPDYVQRLQLMRLGIILQDVTLFLKQVNEGGRSSVCQPLNLGSFHRRFT